MPRVANEYLCPVLLTWRGSLSRCQVPNYGGVKSSSPATAVTSVRFLCRGARHEVDGLDLACTRGRSRPRPMRRAAAAHRHAGRHPGQLAGTTRCCLAALSNDPLGDLNPAAHVLGATWTARCTWPGRPRRRACPRFLFSSSCSLYGAAGSAAVAEDAELNPVTPYGETKVLAERELASSRTTTSAPPTCGTRPPTAPRPGSGWTSW